MATAAGLARACPARGIAVASPQEKERYFSCTLLMLLPFAPTTRHLPPAPAPPLQLPFGARQQRLCAVRLGGHLLPVGAECAPAAPLWPRPGSAQPAGAAGVLARSGGGALLVRDLCVEGGRCPHLTAVRLCVAVCFGATKRASETQALTPHLRGLRRCLALLGWAWVVGVSRITDFK